jgi:hypothetical protein
VIPFFPRNSLASKNSPHRLRSEIQVRRRTAIGSASRFKANRVMPGVANLGIDWKPIALVEARLRRMLGNPGFLLANLSKSRTLPAQLQLPNLH